MTWPTSVATTNLTSAYNSSYQARYTLKNLVDAINAMIASANAESGVAVLDEDAHIPASLVADSVEVISLSDMLVFTLIFGEMYSERDHKLNL